MRNFDRISCCSCCRSAGRLVRVFDPDQPHKTFIMKEGRVLELTEHYVEQGGQMEMKGTFLALCPGMCKQINVLSYML